MIHKAECPQCGYEISVGSQPHVGQQVVCNSCGSELEVVWLDPLELDWQGLVDDEEEYEDLDEEDEY